MLFRCLEQGQILINELRVVLVSHLCGFIEADRKTCELLE